MSLKISKDADIKFGDANILVEGDLAPEATRIRISIMVPGDVLNSLREMAKTKGLPYQTFINQVLMEKVQNLDDMTWQQMRGELRGMRQLLDESLASMRAEFATKSKPTKKRASR